MNYQQVSKKGNTNSDTSTHKSLYSRPFNTQKVTDSNLLLTQQEIENQQYQQNSIETTKLEIQAKHGAITPLGQEKLTSLQAQKSDFWQRSTEKAKRYGHHLSNISVNRSQILAKQSVQAKLAIGAVGDKYEQEADRVAAFVVNQINTPVSEQPNQNIQRLAMSPEQREIDSIPVLQLKAGDSGTVATKELEGSIQQARSSGQPLADNIRKPMERTFGSDFSGVKVHTDSQADELNQSIQAKAFTTGQDVFFRQGAYQPGSRGGQELIAHELTHVVQQNGSAVKPTHLTTSQISQLRNNQAIQRRVGFEFEVDWQVRRPPQTPEEKKQVKTDDKNYEHKMNKGRQAYWQEKWKSLPSVLHKPIYKLASKPNDEKARAAYVKLRVKEGVTPQEAHIESLGLEDYIKGQMNIAKGAKIMAPLIPKDVAQQPLWHLTADMNSGSSQLEWVTEPLNEIEQVEQVMKQITAMGTKLEQLAQNNKVIKSAQLADVGSVKKDYIKSGFQIYPPKDNKLKAAPQVTGGFRLDQIASMMEQVLENKGNKDSTKAIYSDKVDSVQSRESNSIGQALTEAKKVKQLGHSDQMQSLVALILNYMHQASDPNNPLANSKGIANAFMSRTDFAHNFSLTPEAQKKMAPEQFVSLVKRVTDLNINDRLFPAGFKERASDQTVHSLDITRKDWVENIAKGVDLLKKDLGDEQRKNLHGSLGALGKVDDTVGKDKVKAVVIELRRMKDAQPLENWQKIAENAFNFIEEINNPNPQKPLLKRQNTV